MNKQKWHEAFRLSMEKMREGSEFNLGEEALGKLESHLGLLMQWNRVHNLTSVTNVETLVMEHYADSVLALKAWNPLFQSAKPVFDLGAGNGFPGLVAAILYPQAKFVLVESSRKKSSFLRTAIVHLGLQNVQVLNARVESLSGVETAITRAAFSESKIEDLAHAFAEKGILVLLTVPSFPSAKWRIDNSSWMILSRYDYGLVNGAKRSVVILQKKQCFT